METFAKFLKMESKKKSFDIPRRILKAQGLWWDEAATWKYIAIGGLVHLLVIELLTVFHVIFFVQTLEKAVIEDITEVFNKVLTLIAIVVKTFWFLAKTKTIEKMNRKLMELLKFEGFKARNRRYFVETHIDRDVKVMATLYLSAFLAVTLPFVQFLVNHEKKILPFDGYYYFDYKNNDILFWSFGFLQYFASIFACLNNFSIDLVFLFFISLITAAFYELSLEISMIDNLQSSNEDQLKTCVEYHMKIKNFVDEMSENVSFSLFLQSAVSSIILCASVAVLTTVKTRRYSVNELEIHDFPTNR
jgi:hypothetical protein